jgi:hypothetical protein
MSRGSKPSVMMIGLAPERIVFFADGQLLQEFENTFDGDTPDAPGILMLNHWSTGNPGWSGGTSAQNAVLTLSYVKAYFNSSNTTRGIEWRGACGDQWQGQTCQIPDFPPGGIAPESSGALNSGKTEFFMYQDGNVNQTMYPAATGGSSAFLLSTWPVLGWTTMLSLLLLTP